MKININPKTVDTVHTHNLNNKEITNINKKIVILPA